MQTALYEKLLSRRRITKSNCWEWVGAKNNKGYGQTWWLGVYMTVHRAMWLAMHGQQPTKNVLHRTQKDNMFDMTRKGRRSEGERHGVKIRNGWTADLRAMRAKQTKERMRMLHEARAQAAGAPIDWKYCPDCQTWKPRSDYQLNKARYDGIKPICRPCVTIQARRLREKRIARSN